MTIPDELRDVAQRLHREIVQHMSLYMFQAGAPAPHWYGRMLSELVLLLDGEEIEYLTGIRNDTDVEIIVFTKRLLLRSTATDLRGDDPTVVSTAWPRDSITSATISAEESVFSNRAFADWPGRIAVTLETKGVGKITLPLERPNGRDGDTALHGLFRSVLEQLRA